MKSVVTDNVSTSGLGQKIHTLGVEIGTDTNSEHIIVSDNEG